jgi:DNA polymerase (family 10)
VTDLGELISALEEVADLLEVAGDSSFRVASYRRAARQLKSSSLSAEELAAGRFLQVSGIGPQLSAQLSELWSSGHLGLLEELKAQVPEGVRELLGLRGVGPGTARALWEADIAGPQALLEACRSGQVAQLPGFGPKKQAALQAAAEFFLASAGQLRIAQAEQLAQIVQAGDPSCLPVGQLRRRLELVGALEFLGTHPPEEGNWEKLPHGAWQGTLRGYPVTLHPQRAGGRAAQQLVLSGSAEFVALACRRAEQLGLRLDDRGLWKGAELVEVGSEEELLALLGLGGWPPELREPEHTAWWPEDPPTLVETGAIRQLLHVHSRASDGTPTLRELAEAARQRGCALGSADHSRSASYAHGLSVSALRSQLQEIRALQGEGYQIWAGSEVDILADGSLDYPDEVLAELDYVVASVHSHFDLTEAAQTERLIRAVQHPLVTILGHPSGRLLLRRPGYQADLGAVLEAALSSKTIIEINANPHRLDLDWRLALRWRKRLRFAVNTDAHSLSGLDDLRYGVWMARKAGLGPEDLLNTAAADQPPRKEG